MLRMSIEIYRQRAEECDRLAETATTPLIREAILHSAERWRTLAAEREGSDRRARPRQIRQQHLLNANRRGS